MKTKAYILLTVMLGMLFVYLYANMVIDIEDGFFQERNVENVRGTTKIIRYDLGQREKLLLKIKTPWTTELQSLRFNEQQVEKVYQKDSEAFSTQYFVVQHDSVRIGRNILRVTFIEPFRNAIDVRLGNYVKKSGSEWMIFFPEQELGAGGTAGIILSMGIFIIMVLALRFIYLHLFACLAKGKSWEYLTLSLLPGIFLLGVIYFVVTVAGYKIALSRHYFFTFYITTFVSSGAVIIAKNVVAYLKDGRRTMVFNPIWGERINKGYVWVTGREFSDKCVLFFMVLLVLCALFLIVGLEPVAEQLANIAYFALSTGVIIKFIRLCKEKPDSENEGTIEESRT